MSSSITSFSALMLVIYRKAQELPVQQFQDAVLEELKLLVPFDACMWGTATMKPSGIDIHSIHLYKTLPGMLEAYEQVKHLDVAAMEITRHERATLAFNAEVLLGTPELQPLRQFCRDFGHENLLITSDINPLTRFVHWISLYRADPQHVSTPEEVAVVKHLAPHLMQALAINRLVNLERITGDDARVHWSVAIADGHGQLYHADQQFLDLVCTDTGWPCASRDRLAPELMTLLRGTSGTVVGTHAVVQRTLEHGVLFLKARKRHPVDSLSTAEMVVARLLVSGLTQKEVAVKLKRSSETVRSHVRNIFEKLGIGNAVMLGPILSLRT